LPAPGRQGIISVESREDSGANAMIQCRECEFFQRDEHGRVSFACDPFCSIKEPDCLVKWQLIKINQMVEAYQSMLGYYEKLAPMQNKLFKAMERELDDMDEGQKWKHTDDDEDDEEEQTEEPGW